MAQEKIGVESQNMTTKVVVLGLSAVFLTYFVTFFMTLGQGITDLLFEVWRGAILHGFGDEGCHDGGVEGNVIA